MHFRICVDVCGKAQWPKSGDRETIETSCPFLVQAVRRAKSMCPEEVAEDVSRPVHFQGSSVVLVPSRRKGPRQARFDPNEVIEVCCTTTKSWWFEGLKNVKPTKEDCPYWMEHRFMVNEENDG
jgi:hypothetical protein